MSFECVCGKDSIVVFQSRGVIFGAINKDHKTKPGKKEGVYKYFDAKVKDIYIFFKVLLTI